MRLSPKTSPPFIRFPKPVNLSDFYTGVHKDARFTMADRHWKVVKGGARRIKSMA